MKNFVFLSVIIVEITACSSYNYKKLENAVRTNDVKSVEKCIEREVPLSGDMYSRQPLLIAAENANSEIFKMLLVSGADYKCDNYSILSYLVNCNNKELLKILLKNSSITTAMKLRSKGYSIFYWASMQKDSNFIREIDDGKQNWNEENNHIPLLENLVANYDAETINDLLSNNFSIEDLGSKYRSPLGYTLKYGEIQTARVLLLKGFTIDKMSGNPWLTIGAYWIPEFKSLFNTSPDALVNIKLADSGLLSGILFNQNLSEEERIQLFKEFVQLGVDVDAKDPEGGTPLMYLLDSGYGPSIELSEYADKERQKQREYANKLINILYEGYY